MYRSLCTEFYDADKPLAPPDELESLLQHCASHFSILEAMSGTGRFLLPIRAQGYDIEGVDASLDMLAACREKAKKQGISVTLYAQFLHELALPKRYHRILIPAASFGLITKTPQVVESLRCLFDHLLPLGELVIEVEPLRNRPKDLGVVHATLRERVDGAKIVLTTFLSGYDETTQVAKSINKYELIAEGVLLATEYEEFSVRYYDEEQFTRHLCSAGFRVKTVKRTEETLTFVASRA